MISLLAVSSLAPTSPKARNFLFNQERSSTEYMERVLSMAPALPLALSPTKASTAATRTD